MDNNNNSATLQQSTNTDMSVYLHKKSLQKAMVDYEFERKKTDRNFDVYELVGEVLGHTSYTIRKFFQKYDRTGTKLGTEDLLKVCILIGTDAPILALLDDYNSIVSVNCQKKLTHHKTAAIKDNALSVVKKIGDLSGTVSSALSDSRLDLGEKQDLKKIISEAKEELSALENQIQE